ncbi:metalloproteinase inhibitor 2 [Pteropus vampyrus]|uniref:Metalloproteinase inhibitor 2 n=3 Tax=Pteropus TaxID=9401 RepID=A0A6P6CJB8_PTEVA|nr:metalloproteinase inhibitor 2 [Pteropus vampyrus]
MSGYEAEPRSGLIASSKPRGGVNASILNCVVRIEATQSLVCFPRHRYGHLGEEGRGVPTGGRSGCQSPGPASASALALSTEGSPGRIPEPGVSLSPPCPHPRPRPGWSLGSPCPSLLPLPHPQSHEGVSGTLLTSVPLCFAVIRAKVVSEKEVDSGNDIYGNPIKRIQYEIKQIKMFKGPDKDIEFIYTAPSSAICGVSLDVGGKKEYLIAGKAEGNGKMYITLCDFIVPWDTLSTTQKKSLNHRYQMGCECKITRCPMIPCYISSPDECLWMDWVTEKNINGHQAKFFACIKRSDGSCAWYRGAAPPKQEFLDIEDP